MNFNYLSFFFLLNLENLSWKYPEIENFSKIEGMAVPSPLKIITP